MPAHIVRFFRIPERKELVQGPLDGLNALLLTLASIFDSECQGVDAGPVWVQIEI